jgi:hypothetical protein
VNSVGTNSEKFALSLVKKLIAPYVVSAKSPNRKSSSKPGKEASQILKLVKLPVPTKEFAQALSVEEDKLLTHVKSIRDTVDSLKTKAAEIQDKPEPTRAHLMALRTAVASS